ncbi:MAG: DUF1684 domain-containing protein [Anaeromyxobacter sp.]
MRNPALAALTLVITMSDPTSARAAGPAPTAPAKPQQPAAAAAPASPADAWKAWRERRETNLKREDGWLALVALDWLDPGENKVANLPGKFVVEGAPGAWKVRLEAAAADGWTLDGAPVTSRVLATDAAEKPDRLRRGTVQLQVIERGPKVALRVWDSASPVRASFHGVDTFPYDPRWRLEGTWEPFPVPKEVETPSVVGIPSKEKVPGRVRFTIDGKAYTLEPTQEEPGGDLFFVFRDQTSRKETYGAGRFLYAPLPKEGKVVLDFNRAYNPPCAFTPHATCPLPRPENVLAVRIEAGERRFRDH